MIPQGETPKSMKESISILRRNCADNSGARRHVLRRFVVFGETTPVVTLSRICRDSRLRGERSRDGIFTRRELKIYYDPVRGIWAHLDTVHRKRF